MNNIKESHILFEDNHLLIYNKEAGTPVQGDKSGDKSLLDLLKSYIKDRDNKPGNVFLGLIHRVDRPVSGAVMFAKTSKALTRMTNAFKERSVEKLYWALVEGEFTKETISAEDYLLKNPKQNKSYVVSKDKSGAKLARLEYRGLVKLDRYSLVEVKLHTGRHHQIRCQLSTNGNIIKGDVKYGAKRPNKDASIDLHARFLNFEHPTTKEKIQVEAPVPNWPIWKAAEKEV